MSEDGVERRLTTILAADVVGYSRLMAADEAGTPHGSSAKAGEGVNFAGFGVSARQIDSHIALDARFLCANSCPIGGGWLGWGGPNWRGLAISARLGRWPDHKSTGGRSRTDRRGGWSMDSRWGAHWRDGWPARRKSRTLFGTSTYWPAGQSTALAGDDGQ